MILNILSVISVSSVFIYSILMLSGVMLFFRTLIKQSGQIFLYYIFCIKLFYFTFNLQSIIMAEIKQ